MPSTPCLTTHCVSPVRRLLILARIYADRVTKTRLSVSITDVSDTEGGPPCHPRQSARVTHPANTLLRHCFRVCLCLSQLLRFLKVISVMMRSLFLYVRFRGKKKTFVRVHVWIKKKWVHQIYCIFSCFYCYFSYFDSL